MENLAPSLALLTISCLVACSDPDADNLCAVTVTLSGDIAASMPGPIDCSGSSDGPGLDLMFQPRDAAHPIGTFHLLVADVSRGQTGDFQAIVQVFNPGGAIWRAEDCSVTIETHDFRREACDESSEPGAPDVCYGYDEYRLTGHGTCRSPALEAGGGTIIVGPFKFVTVRWWPQ